MNLSPAEKFPRESTRNRGGMSRQNGDLSQYALRLMENAELSQHRSPVAIDFFPGQTVIGFEGVDTAERELDSPPRRREATPHGLTSAIS